MTKSIYPGFVAGSAYAKGSFQGLTLLTAKTFWETATISSE